MGRGRSGPREATQHGLGAAADALRCRLDKWLWAARFFKTRALAMEAIDRNRVWVSGLPAKPSREVHPGDEIEIREPGGLTRTVQVLGLSTVRGPAPVAQQLYAETEASRSAREAALQLRRLGVEPALSQVAGRPTKRDRRDLSDWDRWSARWDDSGHS
ncbi:MAG: RNA-binding S4 domain-containing protein [Burkholderiales bacterium]|nr:RNA-binding S4 domain-containing protein [Burkholderiales bacterium]NBO77007.1 RNA-binding S4 domain-containing protein [Betaproteobacteria bacterium]